MRIEIDTDDWVTGFRYQRRRLIRRLFPRQMEALNAVASIAFYATATRSQLFSKDLADFVRSNFRPNHAAPYQESAMMRLIKTMEDWTQ